MSPDKPAHLLFNIHDLILFMTAGQYCLLALLVYFTRNRKKISYCFLVAILLMSAAQNIDTLILWNDDIRALLLEFSPNVFFWGSLGYWLQGPLLLWYVKSTLYKDFRLSRLDWLHLLPLLVVICVVTVYYYRLAPAEKYNAQFELKFAWSLTMWCIISARFIFIIIYGAVSWQVLGRYRKNLAQAFSNLDLKTQSWLTWIVGGFIALAALNLTIHVFGHIVPKEISNAFGLASNYANLIFANSLVFLHARYSHFFEGVQTPEPHPETDKKQEQEAEPEQFQPDSIKQIEQHMVASKPHLDSEITLDSLARQLKLSERALSRIINHHYNKNFFEFINDYRVEEAKRYLADTGNIKSPVIDAMAASGFRSKSSFNSIFKKTTGLTPTQYRKQVSTLHPTNN